MSDPQESVETRGDDRVDLLATAWFDYLNCSVAELDALLAGTRWRLTAIDDADRPYYLAILTLT